MNSTDTILSFFPSRISQYLHPLLTVAVTAYIILSLINFGLMFDYNPHCVLIEVARLVALLTADYVLTHYNIISGKKTPHNTAVSVHTWKMRLRDESNAEINFSACIIFYVPSKWYIYIINPRCACAQRGL